MSLNKLGEEFVEHSEFDANLDHTVRRAMEELCELLEAISARDSRSGDDEEFREQEVANEMADVVLTLAAGAAAVGVDLDAAIARKHARNLAAEWILQPNGTVKRIKA